MSTQSYIDIDVTMERVNDEICTIDVLINDHIADGVQMKDLWSLARLRANLSQQRIDLQAAMDKAEAVTEVCMNIDNLEFDVESTLNGRGFISLETIR